MAFPRAGQHGIVDAFPIKAWCESKSEQADLVMSRLISTGSLSDETALYLLKRHLPTVVKQRLLEPFPNKERVEGEVRVPSSQEYPRYRVPSRSTVIPDEVRVKAAKGAIALGIHLYLGAFLARGENAIKALHHPGNPALNNLNLKQRLALGAVRETVILVEFKSLRSFWSTFQRLKREGYEYAGFFEGGLGMVRENVYRFLKDDEDALNLYEVLMTLVCLDDGALYEVVASLFYYLKHPMQEAIGDSALAAQMLIEYKIAEYH